MRKHPSRQIIGKLSLSICSSAMVTFGEGAKVGQYLISIGLDHVGGFLDVPGDNIHKRVSKSCFLKGNDAAASHLLQA